MLSCLEHVEAIARPVAPYRSLSDLPGVRSLLFVISVSVCSTSLAHCSLPEEKKLMAEELEKLWSKLSFTEEEDEGIELGSSCTKAARAVGRNCVVMKVLSPKSINLDALRKNMRMLWKPNKGV